VQAARLRNALPAQDRGRARQFCGTECARRYHNDARIPVPPVALAADSPADPLAALDTAIRQAAVLIRAAREQAASLDPARVRAQIAEAGAAQHRAEAAAVTAAARAAEAQAETQALAEALDAAREDTRRRPGRRNRRPAGSPGSYDRARAGPPPTPPARSRPPRPGAAGQVSATQAEAARAAR